MKFEHWHSACQNARLSREAMVAVVGEGELVLIERAKQAGTEEHSE